MHTYFAKFKEMPEFVSFKYKSKNSGHHKTHAVTRAKDQNSFDQ